MSINPIKKTLLAGLAAATLMVSPSWAAGDAPDIERQKWSFAGITGQFDKNQLQRGFQVYKTVCAACHALERVAFRNLAEPGGPEFPLEDVKLLAAGYEITDGPNDEGKMFKRKGKLSDRFPSPYANVKEARAIHNGAYPPDLSLMARARNVETKAAWYIHPFLMLKDIASGYQEGGVDYLYALMTGYKDEPPKDMKMSEGMNYNAAYPGHQIAMVNPLAEGAVQYQDGTPSTVENYARDVTAFLAWTADPHLNKRKQMGWQVLLYLLVTAVLLFLAKRRIWSKVDH